MKKPQRELARAFPFAKIEHTNGGHIKLTLPNDRFVIASATPSDWREMHHTRARVRRALARKQD